MITTGTRRTPSEYNFLTQDFDELLLPTSGTDRRSTYPRRSTVQHIDIHHMTIHDSADGAALRACVSTWANREASAHYGIDNDRIAQFVYDDREAWANANSAANQSGVSIEHANSATGDPSGWPISAKTIANSVKLVAALHVTHKLGRPHSAGFGASGTIRTHNSFYATACPGPYFKKIWSSYVMQCQTEYDRITNKFGPAPVMPVPKPPEALVTKISVLHWNVAGSDKVNGYAAANSYRGDDLGLYARSLLFDVFLACEASQNDLRAGISKGLGLASWMQRAKAIWYDPSKVKNFASRKAYSDSFFAYFNSLKWGAAFFGTKNGIKFSVLEIHTDYRAPAKQAKQVQSIFKKWRVDCDKLGIKHVNTFVVGDLNWDGTAGDNPFHALSSVNFEEKGSRTQSTFMERKHLDGVLAHKNSRVSVSIKPRTNGRMRLSDHNPVKFIAELQ